MNPVGLSIRSLPLVSRQDAAPAAAEVRPSRSESSQTRLPVLPLEQAGELADRLEAQTRKLKYTLTPESGLDLRTRRAVASYNALSNSGQAEIVSELLGFDEYA